MAPTRLAEMIEALDANGLLDGHDALLTGYLPSAAHVALACDVVDRLARRGPRFKIVVDPILGDDPKGLYLAEEAALAVRDRLLPLADVMTPNCFELGWLTGRSVATMAEAREAAESLTRGSERAVLVTSPPIPDGDTGVFVVGPHEEALFRAPRIANVPHGSGDAFSAMIAAGVSVGAVLGHLQALVEASSGADRLAIVSAADRWIRAPVIASERLPAAED